MQYVHHNIKLPAAVRGTITENEEKKMLKSSRGKHVVVTNNLQLNLLKQCTYPYTYSYSALVPTYIIIYLCTIHAYNIV